MPSAQPLVAQSLEIVEATIDDIHAAYRAGILTAWQLAQMYLDRIAAYDKKGPVINAIISLIYRLELADDVIGALMTSERLSGSEALDHVTGLRWRVTRESRLKPALTLTRAMNGVVKGSRYF